MMNIIFFDTETTGVPRNYKAPVTDLDNWPRVTQLAWRVYDEHGNLVNSCLSLIKPDGWTVPKEKFFIDNNMSTERCEADGMPMETLLQRFLLDMSLCDTIVAHNLAFDIKIIGAEMIRYGFVMPELKQVCTMMSSTDICKIPGTYGYKWPKLNELYQHLFGRSFEGAHDAMVDVTVCAECYFEMLMIAVIK